MHCEGATMTRQQLVARLEALRAMAWRLQYVPGVRALVDELARLTQDVQRDGVADDSP